MLVCKFPLLLRSRFYSFSLHFAPLLLYLLFPSFLVNNFSFLVFFFLSLFSLLFLAHITQCDIKTQTLRPFIIEEKLRAAGLQRYGVKRTVETRFSFTPWKKLKFCLSDRLFCYVCLILSFGLICEMEHFRSLSVSNARKSLFLLFIYLFFLFL